MTTGASAAGILIGGIGGMRFAIDEVPVNLGMKSFADLGGGTGKFNQHAALVDSSDREAVSAKPVDHGVDVILCRSKAAAELFRGEPPMKVRRLRIMESIDEFIKRLLALGAAFELKLNVRHEEIAGHGALIELRARRHVGIAGEAHKFRFIHRLRSHGEQQGGEQDKRFAHEGEDSMGGDVWGGQ